MTICSKLWCSRSPLRTMWPCCWRPTTERGYTWWLMRWRGAWTTRSLCRTSTAGWNRSTWSTGWRRVSSAASLLSRLVFSCQPSAESCSSVWCFTVSVVSKLYSVGFTVKKSLMRFYDQTFQIKDWIFFLVPTRKRPQMNKKKLFWPHYGYTLWTSDDGGF